MRDYPFTALKVDRAFVSGLGTAPGADAIVRAILALANGLELEVVAEGVETAVQQAFLAAEGCQIGQGYLWSRPLAPGWLRCRSAGTGSTAGKWSAVRAEC